MESRMEKYYEENENLEYSRSKKNERLYKEVSGSYSSLDHLPVSDNVSEIDMERLRQMVNNHNDYKKNNSSVAIMDKETDINAKYHLEDKEYDINKLIEKARSTNTNIETKKESRSSNFLKTLELNELSNIDEKVELKETNFSQEEKTTDNKLNNEEEKKYGNTLSLDILSDLKPTGDTVVMEAIDTKGTSTLDDIPIDIDIFEDNKSKEQAKDFYTGTYNFTKNDFFDGDEDILENKHGNVFVKMLLVIFILSLCATAIYFAIELLGTK